MRVVLIFIALLCISYMVLRPLVLAGSLMLWALHIAFPVLVLLVVVFGLIYLSVKRS